MEVCLPLVLTHTSHRLNGGPEAPARGGTGKGQPATVLGSGGPGQASWELMAF